MAVEGSVKIVVEGDEVKGLVEVLTDFIAKGRENQEYEFQAEEGVAYKIEKLETEYSSRWTIVRYVNGTYECFSDCPTDEELSIENGVIRFQCSWYRDSAILRLCQYLVKQYSVKVYYLDSDGSNIITNDAEFKYFEDKLEIVDYYGSEEEVDGYAPNGWDEEWDTLTIEGQKALCDRYGFAYATVEIVSDNN